MLKCCAAERRSLISVSARLAYMRLAQHDVTAKLHSIPEKPTLLGSERTTRGGHSQIIYLGIGAGGLGAGGHSSPVRPQVHACLAGAFPAGGGGWGRCGGTSLGLGDSLPLGMPQLGDALGRMPAAAGDVQGPADGWRMACRPGQVAPAGHMAEMST